MSVTARLSVPFSTPQSSALAPFCIGNTFRVGVSSAIWCAISVGRSWSPSTRMPPHTLLPFCYSMPAYHERSDCLCHPLGLASLVGPRSICAVIVHSCSHSWSRLGLMILQRYLDASHSGVVRYSHCTRGRVCKPPAHLHLNCAYPEATGSSKVNFALFSV